MTRAFLFPGQGSQSIGMMAAMSVDFAVVTETFDEASAALGYDLWNIIQNGPENRLNSTEVTQPAMLTAGIATWRAWQAAGGPVPDVMAGHSLGEYTALVCAGSLVFSDAVSLVALRGSLMQQATPAGSGAMAAILGLDDATVIALCDTAGQGQVVSAANFNSPGQVVIAGESAAVERACEAARSAGARRVMLLPVSVPSHCELMRGAAEKLSAGLDRLAFSVATIPVWHNATVGTSDSVAQIKDALVRQLFMPVRWSSIIQQFIAAGTTLFAECGPGRVLTGLNRRIDRSAPASAIIDAGSLNATIADWSG